MPVLSRSSQSGGDIWLHITNRPQEWKLDSIKTCEVSPSFLSETHETGWWVSEKASSKRSWARRQGGGPEKGLLGQRNAPAKMQDVGRGERRRTGTVAVSQDQIAKALVLYAGT